MNLLIIIRNIGIKYWTKNISINGKKSCTFIVKFYYMIFPEFLYQPQHNNPNKFCSTH